MSNPSAAARRLRAAMLRWRCCSFVVLLALVDEGFAAREHEVHHAGELVGDRGVGTRLVHAGAQPAVERAERRVVARQAHGRQLERLAHPVGRAPGACAESTLPPLILVPGHSPSHEQKCLTLAKRLRSGPISERIVITVVDRQSVDAREVDARPARQRGARIEPRACSCCRVLSGAGPVRRRDAPTVTSSASVLRVALEHPQGQAVDYIASACAQHEQVLLAPVARQRPLDVARAGLDAAVAVPGQHLGVTLAGHDRRG